MPQFCRLLAAVIMFGAAGAYSPASASGTTCGGIFPPITGAGAWNEHANSHAACIRLLSRCRNFDMINGTERRVRSEPRCVICGIFPCWSTE